MQMQMTVSKSDFLNDVKDYEVKLINIILG